MIYSNAKDAKAAGVNKYFTGVACKNGHVDFRLVSNRTCIACETLRKNKAKVVPVEMPLVAPVVKIVRKVVFKAIGRERRGFFKFNSKIVSDVRVAVNM